MNPRVNLKTRVELADFDYLNQLNPTELRFLNTFCEGWNNADFRDKRTKDMFKTDKERKECYSNNNSRNRCIYTRAKASGNVIEQTEIQKTKETVYEKHTYTKNEDDLTPDEVEEIRIQNLLKELE